MIPSARPPAPHETAALPAIFIADLHIAPERPDIAESFVQFCQGRAREARSVYILGDLFEVWIGDDDDDPGWQESIRALADLTAAGVRVGFMPGNRDFLIGPGFAARTGIELLAEPTLIDLAGRRTLLLHGDELCTDDTEHQTFRSEVRGQAWQSTFLARTLAERRALASRMRAASRRSIREKSTQIMDVNAVAVADSFRAWQAECIIHGHTHRPARHPLQVDGQPVERWVLGDWFEQASLLLADDDGIHAIRE